MRHLLIAVVCLTACRSDLSGPEAERFAQALQNPWADTSRAHLQELWDRLGAQPFRPDAANPGGPLQLLLDGAPIPGRGFVVQTVLKGLDPGEARCRDDRFTLLAWTLQDPSQAVILAGGDFADPLAPPQPCDAFGLLSPHPVLSLRQMTGPEGPVSFAQAGHASVLLIDSKEGCPFVTDDAVAYLRWRGIQCSRGSYAASASASLWPDSTPTQVSIVALPSVQLPGVRWVIDCAQPNTDLRMCGRY